MALVGQGLVAGALFDQGLLNGVQGKNLLRMPEIYEARLISRIVGLSLGLGYAGQRDSKASCFQINAISQINTTENTTEPRFQINAHIAIDEHIPCELSDDAVKAALGALSLALRLSCSVRAVGGVSVA